MASTIDTEVDAADDLPHFLISAPPLYQSNNHLLAFSTRKLNTLYLMYLAMDATYKILPFEPFQ